MGRRARGFGALRIAWAACLSLGLATVASAQAPLERTPAPEGVQLYFISPADGETLKSPVTVRFGLSGMGVAPAGVAFDETGHHHLIVDRELAALDQPIPADEQHLHFGGGKTQATIELSPGEHELQLVFGDHNHIPHDPPVASQRIRITVE